MHWKQEVTFAWICEFNKTILYQKKQKQKRVFFKKKTDQLNLPRVGLLYLAERSKSSIHHSGWQSLAWNTVFNVSHGLFCASIMRFVFAAVSPILSSCLETNTEFSQSFALKHLAKIRELSRVLKPILECWLRYSERPGWIQNTFKIGGSLFWKPKHICHLCFCWRTLADAHAVPEYFCCILCEAKILNWDGPQMSLKQAARQ